MRATVGPIIFSAPMVLALLAGKKKMTRRLMRSARKGNDVLVETGWHLRNPGDRLYVRESLACKGDGMWRYAADGAGIEYREASYTNVVMWANKEERGMVPSIHMPRWASRLTLTVSAVKVEPLQNITEADARAEGVESRDAFMALWCQLHSEESWFANPEVVAISFTVDRRNVDSLPAWIEGDAKTPRAAGNIRRV